MYVNDIIDEAVESAVIDVLGTSETEERVTFCSHIAREAASSGVLIAGEYGSDYETVVGRLFKMNQNDKDEVLDYIARAEMNCVSLNVPLQTYCDLAEAVTVNLYRIGYRRVL